SIRTPARTDEAHNSGSVAGDERSSLEGGRVGEEIVQQSQRQGIEGPQLHAARRRNGRRKHVPRACCRPRPAGVCAGTSIEKSRKLADFSRFLDDFEGARGAHRAATCCPLGCASLMRAEGKTTFFWAPFLLIGE